MKNWHIQPQIPVPAWAQQVVPGHPLIAQALIRRGILDVDAAQQYLNPDAYTPADAYDLPDMREAVTRIQTAIRDSEKILVWGDFDVDGQTATSLLVSALRGLGADVQSYIPDRHTEGHGIHTGKLRSLIEGGAQVVLTCDTGISAHEAVEEANKLGVNVVITDHHQLPETLPPAFAAVNSQRLPEGHPLRTLPGVGVAFKLVEALYAEARRADEVAQFLDLVALGLVADVVVLTGDARYLLQRGLNVLRQAKRRGLWAMYDLADIDPLKIDEETIGFSIAPRLNAVGRLGDANVSVEFLTTNDDVIAKTLANQLEGLNNLRKQDTESVTAAALALIEQNPKLLESPALVLAKEGWPGGIIGIVANRLVEMYGRPVVLLAMDGADAHGSARSVPGVDITAAIKQVAEENPTMIRNYGGHTMAAGMGLAAADIADFRRALGRAVGQMIGTVDTTPTLTIEGMIPLADISLDLIYGIRQLAPFGPGNPPMTLASPRVTLKAQRQIGRSGNHQRLTVEDEMGGVQDILWWRAEPEKLPKGRFDLAYTLGINEFQGKTSVQAVLVDFRAVDEEPLSFAAREHVPVRDFRALPFAEQLAKLKALPPETLIWNEGEMIEEIETVRRLEAVRRHRWRRAPKLAIWTAPPNQATLNAALEAVNPAEIFLFSTPPAVETLPQFVDKLGGTVKHALNALHGQADLNRMAGRLGQTTEAVIAGLKWLQAQGKVTIIHNDGITVRLQKGGAKDESKVGHFSEEIKQHVAESESYRRIYAKAAPENLIRVGG